MNSGADTNKTGNKRLAWRWMILVSVSVIILLVVISPTIMFVIRKSNIDVQLRSHCWVGIDTNLIVYISHYVYIRTSKLLVTGQDPMSFRHVHVNL
jgi:hypothetical protein